MMLSGSTTSANNHDVLVAVENKKAIQAQQEERKEEVVNNQDHLAMMMVAEESVPHHQPHARFLDGTNSTQEECRVEVGGDRRFVCLERYSLDGSLTGCKLKYNDIPCTTCDICGDRAYQVDCSNISPHADEKQGVCTPFADFVLGDSGAVTRAVYVMTMALVAAVTMMFVV